MATKAKCPCPGPCCGDLTYDEMLKAMEARFLGANVTHEYLRQVHLKWKRIAAEVR